MSQKKDEHIIFKVIFSTITGAAAFLLLFDYFRKGGNKMDMGSMSGGAMNYGYGTGDLLGGLLFFLVKFLLVVLVVAAIAGAVIWIKNNFFKESGNQLTQAINNDPVLKLVTTVTLAILGVVLVFSIFDSFSRPGGQMNMGYGYGFNAGYSITWFLNIVIQLLLFVFMASLAGAAFVYLKKEFEKGTFNLNEKKNVEITTTQATEEPKETVKTETAKPETTKTDLTKEENKKS